MKKIVKILTWLKNLILSIISIPGYIAMLPCLAWIILCELGKGNKGYVIPIIKEYRKKKKVNG